MTSRPRASTIILQIVTAVASLVVLAGSPALAGVGPAFPISAVAPNQRVQGSPAVAYGGATFFVVWRDDRNYAASGYNILGARVSEAGTVLDPGGILISGGPHFDPSPGNQYFPSVAFDGTNFLVAWVASTSPGGVSYRVFGARVTPAGQVLDPGGFPITTTARFPLRMPSLACDGSNCLVAWREASNQTYGARVSKAGAVLDPAAFLIPGTFYPYVAFDGGNSLVVSHAWGSGLDVLGARVAPGGILLDASALPISAAAGDQDHASVAFGGEEYLVVWHDRGTIRGARVLPGGGRAGYGGDLDRRSRVRPVSSATRTRHS